MTKCYLDSNVLISLKNEDSDKHNESENLLRELIFQEVPMLISPLCLDEFIHAIRLQLIQNKKEAIFQKLHQILNETLEIPNLLLVNPPTDFNSQLSVISLMETFSLRPRDAYHLLTMQAHEIDAFATFDNDFKKVFAKKLLIKA